MSLEEQINTAWKDAMKARDPKKEGLSLIRTELKSFAINTRGAGERTGLSDEDVIEVLGKMAKQRRESIAEYEKGGRQDLVDKESLELSVIEAYLPAPLSEAELGKIVDEVIAETGASSMKDMGKVMAPILAKAKGRADGKQVQAIVKQRFGG